MNARLARPARAGFTLPEILIVIVMISLLSLVAVPRFANANARRHVDSARLRVAAGLATARQAAIQKGQSVEFKIVNDSLTVKAGSTDLMSPVPLYTLYKVDASDVTIVFGSRGFETSPLAERTITLTRSGVPTQSVVVTKFGMVKQ